MKKRFNIILGSVLLLASIFVSATLANLEKAPERKKQSESNLDLPVFKIENKSLNKEIDILGQLTPVKKVKLYAEVSGVLQSGNKDFLEGISFQKGEELIDINSEEAYLGLLSARSQFMNLITQILPDLKFDYPKSYENWKTYLEDFQVEESIRELPEAASQQEKFFMASKNIYKTYYDIKSQETKFAKYQLKAPFDGMVSSSNIKPGDLVRNGQLLGEFISISSFDLECVVDLEHVNDVHVGDLVVLSSETVEGSWKGYVNRVNNSVDQKTQSVKLSVRVSDPQLREGMFLSGQIHSSEKYEAVEIPRKYILNNESVYTVNNGVVQERIIDIVQLKESSAIVSGLENGTLISKKLKGIENNMKAKAIL